MITPDYLRQQRCGQAAVHLFSLLQQKPEPHSLSVPNKREITKPNFIRLHRRADIALRTLMPEDQRIVSALINQLKLSLKSVLASGQAQRANEQENLYVMKDSDLRILFLLKNEEIEIQDIYGRERLINIFG